MFLPELSLLKDVGEYVVGAIERPIQASEEPRQPWCDVQVTFLGPFQDVVVGVALQSDLRRHAVKALRVAFRASECHIGNCSCDAAVAVFKGMDGDKPQVGYGCLDNGVDILVGVEPIQEG